LLPLGFSTWLAAIPSKQGEPWALRIVIANAIVVFTLPLSAVAFIRRSEHYTAPLFLTGVLLTLVIALLMAVATVSLVRRQCRGDHR
jgi:hypothetical protein